jgi:DNA-binding NarL/FixJ family response regulator
MVSVLIADDEKLVRAGFRLILNGHPELEVVGDAGDGIEAVRLTKELQPDVVLMDIRMPRLDGIEATKRIVAEAEASRVLILTTFDLDKSVYDAMRAGASGFLLKTVPPSQLMAAILDVANGDVLLAPEITRRLVERFVRRPAPGSAASPELAALTPRELEVLACVARGHSNAEIATRLTIAETTVKTHVARILMKLGLRDRAQAVMVAYEAGLIEPGATGTDDSLRSE